MTTRRDLEDWYAALSERHPEMVGGERAQKRPRNARGHWSPVLLRVYGIRPWEVGKLTIGELRQIAEDLERHGASH